MAGVGDRAQVEQIEPALCSCRHNVPVTTAAGRLVGAAVMIAGVAVPGGVPRALP